MAQQFLASATPFLTVRCSRRRARPRVANHAVQPRACSSENARLTVGCASAGGEQCRAALVLVK
eukprot:4064511-Alexandrium_andersonii.AAC.1